MFNPATVELIAQDTGKPTELIDAVREILIELVELGVTIEQKGDDAADDQSESSLNGSLILNQLKGYLEFVDDRCMIYPLRVTPRALVDLVRFRNGAIFQRGLNELEMRISALGWAIYPDPRRSHPQDLAVNIGDGTTIYYNRTPEDLANLTNNIERAELRKEIYDHDAELQEAYSGFAIIDNKISFSIKDGDPVTTWSLSRRNVNLVIDMARTIIQNLTE